MKRGWLCRIAVAGLLAGIAGTAQAVNRTWTGASSADWGTAGNWNPAAVPAAGDNVYVDASGTRTTILSADSASLSLFAIADRTLIFTNWSTRLLAASVAVRSGGGYGGHGGRS